MTSKRARKGGEIGKNGEFYEGGKFLPSTRLPKRGRQSRSSGNGQVLVEPGMLAIIPEGRVAIFPQIREFVRFEEGRAVAKFDDNHPAVAYHFGDRVDRLHKLIAMYNEHARHYPKGTEL